MKLDVSTEEDCKLACALRGPDLPFSCSRGLKWLFTGPIRSLLGAKNGMVRPVETPPFYSEREKGFLLNEIRECVNEYALGLVHWLSHVEGALVILQLRFPEFNSELGKLADLSKAIKVYAHPSSEPRGKWLELESLAEALEAVEKAGKRPSG